MRYYKWFADRGPVYGKGEYVLDGGWQPRIEGELIPCERGYHVCLEQDLALWRGTELAEIEIDPEGMIEAGDKVVVRSWRLVRWLPWTLQDMMDCAKVDADAASAYSVSAPAASNARAAANYVAEYATHACFAADTARVANYAANYAAEAAASPALFAAAEAARKSERQRQKEWILARIKENEEKEVSNASS